MALWVRFAHGGAVGFGELEGERIAVHQGDIFAGAAPSGESVALADVQLLAPVQPRRAPEQPHCRSLMWRLSRNRLPGRERRQPEPWRLAP
jgi:hypothetical protein